MGTHLDLNLPEQGPRPANAFDIRPKKVEQWLAELPMANIGETARQIFGVLTEINRYTLPPQDRLRLLEVLREPVHYLSEAFKKHFVGISLPLPGKSRKTAGLTRAIYAEMGTGYKIALENSQARPRLFQDNKTLALLTHRAITYQGQVLLTTYQIYAPVPGGLWRELHALYRFAEERKLAANTVIDNRHRLLPKSTLASEYKRVLLLALASPYRLRQGEVEKVYVNLERWAQPCRLGQLSQNGRFVIVLNADYPPSYMPPSQAKHHPQYCRGLDTDELARVLREQIMHNTEETLTTLTGIDLQTPTLSNDLMRRLMLTWGMTPQRSYSRVDKRDNVQVALGLSAAHHFIPGRSRQQHTHRRDTPAEGAQQFSLPAHYDSQPVKDINQTQPDVWEMIYSHDTTPLEPLRDNEPAQPPSFETSLGERNYHTQVWQIINESAGGCCLVNPVKEHASVLVGELVAFHPVDAPMPYTWHIGVIRWMKDDATKGLHLGIQMLSPAADIGGVKPASQPRQENYERTLLLPALTGINQPATLVLPPVPYREGNKLLLQVANGETPVALTKMVENTGLFAQFQFSLPDTSAPKRNHPESTNEHDFSTLWSTL